MFCLLASSLAVFGASNRWRRRRPHANKGSLCFRLLSLEQEFVDGYEVANWGNEMCPLIFLLPPTQVILLSLPRPTVSELHRSRPQQMEISSCKTRVRLHVHPQIRRLRSARHANTACDTAPADVGEEPFSIPRNAMR